MGVQGQMKWKRTVMVVGGGDGHGGKLYECTLKMDALELYGTGAEKDVQTDSH